MFISLIGKTGINHFRITAVCGDFYIGGRQFDSLQDLIGYYTHKSDLLKHERLRQPVAPPEPVNDRKRAIAILPYTKMPDTDELTFQKGIINIVTSILDLVMDSGRSKLFFIFLSIFFQVIFSSFTTIWEMVGFGLLLIEQENKDWSLKIL